MKLGAIINALPALQKLAAENLTIKTLYKLDKQMRRLEKEIDFFNAERNKAIEELCEKDNGSQYIIPEKNRGELEKRLQELAGLDIEPDIEAVKISTGENIKLTYIDLSSLKGIVELYDPDEK